MMPDLGQVRSLVRKILSLWVEGGEDVVRAFLRGLDGRCNP